MFVTRVLEEQGLVAAHFGHRHDHQERAVETLRFRPYGTLKKSWRLGLFWHRRLRGAFKFCFVRHPLSWYESWWRYMQGRGWHPWGPAYRGKTWHPNQMLDGLGSPDFNTFVSNVARARPGYVTELYSWYTAPSIEFVGRQENLKDDLATVLRRLDLPFDEDRLRSKARENESPSEPIEWDPRVRAEVLRLEHAGLVAYGYAEAIPRPLEV